MGENVPDLAGFGPRYLCGIAAAFLAGLLLLFHQGLPSFYIEHMIPALIIYALGVAVLGTIHRLLGYRYSKEGLPNTEKTLPEWKAYSIYILHVVWFGLLIAYLFCYSIL